MVAIPNVDLSVILPTYKRDSILCNTLSQLIIQDPAPLEIIVVDQTLKHTPEASDFIKKLVSENKIKYIYQELPRANTARNRGVLEARAGIVLILNDDIVIGQGLIGAHFRNFSDPEIAAVSGLVYEHTDKMVYDFPARYYWKHTGWMYFPLNYGTRCPTINLNACNLSVRKDIFMEAGGFDENFIKTSYDDSDLSIRIHKLCLKKGLKTVHDPLAGITHLLEPTGPGENRPSGYNEYVIADRRTWETWLYFFIINFGLNCLWEVSLKFRRCVLRKKNILRPYYLWKAFIEFILGLFSAIKLIRGGRRLILSKQ
jgi:GT2 family glycosyltransferase